MLQQLAQRAPEDPFPQYGVAMELRKQGRVDEAVAAFGALCERHPAYVPCYLMYGELLAKHGRTAEAAAIFYRGIAAARDAGDGHALGELESARAALP